MQILQNLVHKYQLQDRIIFKPRMPYGEMMKYTAASDLGLTLDKGDNLNYKFSLPNKIFDYIHAGIPILSSRLPELERIVSKYNIGTFIESHDPVHIAETMKNVFSENNRLELWKKNLQLAAAQLNWEEEEKKFPDIIHELR